MISFLLYFVDIDLGKGTKAACDLELNSIFYLISVFQSELDRGVLLTLFLCSVFITSEIVDQYLILNLYRETLILIQKKKI